MIISLYNLERGKHMEVNPLQIIPINVLGLIDDLRVGWSKHVDYKTNTTAFAKAKEKGSNVMFCCPHHAETNPSCGIKTSYPYTWNCFGCGAKGNLGQLVAHALNLPTEVHGEYYVTRGYLVKDNKEKRKLDIGKIIDGKGKVSGAISEDYIKTAASKYHTYMINRGFKLSTLRKFEVGFDEEARVITFIVRDIKGNPRTINRRSVDTKRFINDEVSKRDLVYGLYYIMQAGIVPKELYLTESPTDTLSCYQSGKLAGAIMGRILFKEQLEVLIRSGVKTLNLFFDNDKAGVECTLLASRMISDLSPIKVNCVVYPCKRYGVDTTNKDDILYKDANDLLNANLLKGVEVIPFTTYLMELKMAKLVDINEIMKKHRG